MIKIGKLLLPVLGIILMATGCASAPQKASGSTTGKDMKIVATSVAICEILDELGFDNVIGIPETSNSIPEKYAQLTTVGSPMNPDLEIIKSLSPDLVLSPKSLEASLSESYRAAGITSAFLDLSSVEGMYSAIISLGEFLHCQEAAKKLNDDYKTYMEGYREGSEEGKDILLLMAFPDGFYLVATENSYVGNLVKLAGGNNVYDSSYNGDENGFVNINPEDIVQKKPDHIFVFAPERVIMTGSARSLDDTVHEILLHRAESIAKAAAEGMGVSWELKWLPQMPSVVNKDGITELARKAAVLTVGVDNVTDTSPCLGSEDFAVFGEHISSFFYWVGSGKQDGTSAGWHNPRFKVEPGYLNAAVPLLVNSVLVG